MISREEAKEKLAQIKKDKKPVKTGATLPIRPKETFDVYAVPLEYLVPNVRNDRITWKIREYEAENNTKLDINNDADVEYLYNLIENDNKKANDNTLEDLAKHGQQVDGVITNTGIIIDGNRRATLIRKLFNGEASKYQKSVEDFRTFNAIILDGDIDEKEIMALETLLQIGSDKPVGYNRICLYLKVDNLLNVGYKYDQIKQYMNLKSAKDVEDMKHIYDLMIQYLTAIGKPNHFTMLDGLEDQFINIKTVFQKLDNQTYDANWDYQESDVADFKTMCFDFMRAKFEGKKFRDKLVGKPQKTDGVFIEESVWKNFWKNHNDIIDANNPQNEDDWKLLGKKDGKFEHNLNDAEAKLASVKNDKNISYVIKDIRIKVDTLKNLLENAKEVDEKDIKNLKTLSSEIYKLTKDYE
ncbi:MAG: hypothetical protein K5829_03680 [Treponema sp.]|nr:hypothetical protein [Treponema sp.]